ncbi:MAG: type II toxin-antitoxin system VapC family toxin, partial [Gammaproteobacteria bacterium]
MFAIDTNVLIRYLVNDDAAQGARARALIDRENVWVSKTVVLESAWVLEAVYH